MKQFFLHLASTRERGQTMIFFAVLSAALMLTLGVTVEGGRVFVEYRHMQAAADMAALVGAQDLPNQTNARNDACQYLQSNGNYATYSAGTCSSATNADGTATPTICVPPQSKAPYSSVSFVYGASNSTCSSSVSGNQFYIETKISENLGTIPIFGIPVTLSAHAIARNGSPSPRDFALAILDHGNLSNALKFGGSANPGFVMVGPATVNSTSSSAIGQNGSGHPMACTGQWLVTGSQPIPSPTGAGDVQSKNTLDPTNSPVTPTFAPPDCLGNGIGVPGSCAGPYDCSTAFFPNSPQIADPYCGSGNPPTQGAQTTISDALGGTTCNGSSTGTTSMSNCAPCSSNGWYYQFSTDSNGNTDRGANTSCASSAPGTECTAPSRGDGWAQATATKVQLSGKIGVEFFPGVYPGGIKLDSSGTATPSAFFNPGVYTLGGVGLVVNSQVNICIYGSPSCDRGASSNIPTTTSTCSSFSFGTDPSQSSYATNGSLWYYYCSPWGTWDSNLCLGYSGSGGCTSGTTCTSASLGSGGTGTCPRPSSLTSAPTFINGAYTPSVPMNGVTFNLVSGASLSLTGGGGEYVAAPNPCPGTSSASTGSVPFPAGASTNSSGTQSQTYSYPAGDIAWQDGKIEGQSSPTSGSSNWTYPNVNLQLSGECLKATPSTSAGDVWANEFATGQDQHLHFLVFDRSANSAVSLGGGTEQNFFGIVYDWAGVDGCGNLCTVSLSGSSGGANGPPLLLGQVIADNFSVSGSATAEVYYRPCDPSLNQCSDGPGSGLVQ